MGCMGSCSKYKLHPDLNNECISATAKYIFYLAETSFNWQLILYNIENNKFTTIKINIQLLLPSCEGVIIGPVLYTTGGFERGRNSFSSKKCNAVYFQRLENIVESLSDMEKSRCKHSISSIGDSFLCVLGGFEQENEITASSEIYNIKADSWQQISNLNHPRVSAGICTVGNRFIFVFGGRPKPLNNLMDPDFIECMDFNSEMKAWHIIKYTTNYMHIEPKKLWCTGISDTEILIFGTEKITAFDCRTGDMKILGEDEDYKQMYFPDRKGEIKKQGNEIFMILEAGGNVGIFSIVTKKWRIIPHIVLGLE